MLIGQKWKPVYDTIQGEEVIIGYVSQGSVQQFVDREGTVHWVEEAGIESTMSPIDFIGPGMLGSLFGRITGRVAGKAASRVVGRIAAGGTASVASRVSLRLAFVLDKMKMVAIRLLSRRAAQVVSGPLGTVARSALEAAAKSTGSTITVVTRLTARPQVGRALSVAVGENAGALASMARTAGTNFVAKIPKALIMELERVGLASLKTTEMGGVIAKEYRFLAAASEFIVPFFK